MTDLLTHLDKLRQFEEELNNQQVYVIKLKKQINDQKKIVSKTCIDAGGHKWVKQCYSGGMRDNNDFDYKCEICGLE